MNPRFAASLSLLCWLVVATGCAAPACEISETQDIEVSSGQEALAVLMEGNERFVEGHCFDMHASQVRRAMLEGGQHPFAVILGCSDSRVVPELIFDIGLGDVFVIRVAGNIIGPDEAGSIEYGMDHLYIPLVLVLGHEGCGAVTGAWTLHDEEEPEELNTLLANVRASLVDIDPALPLEERVHLGVDANVRHSVRQLQAIADRMDLPLEERTLILGAVYQLDTGRVKLLDLDE